jgi:hypothetical protein
VALSTDFQVVSTEMTSDVDHISAWSILHHFETRVFDQLASSYLEILQLRHGETMDSTPFLKPC